MDIQGESVTLSEINTWRENEVTGTINFIKWTNLDQFLLMIDYKLCGTWTFFSFWSWGFPKNFKNHFPKLKLLALNHSCPEWQIGCTLKQL